MRTLRNKLQGIISAAAMSLFVLAGATAYADTSDAVVNDIQETYSAESASEVASVAVKTAPAKTSYYAGDSLDLAGGDTTDGTNIQQWSKTGGKHQEWRLVALDNGYCKIVSMADESKCIAAADSTGANGVNVELAAYSGADNQQWKLIQDGAFYGIVSKAANDGAGLDVYDWSTESG